MYRSNTKMLYLNTCMCNISSKVYAIYHLFIVLQSTGVDLRKKINWPNGPVKFLNNWPLQNSTGLRNIGPGSGLI